MQQQVLILNDTSCSSTDHGRVLRCTTFWPLFFGHRLRILCLPRSIVLSLRRLLNTSMAQCMGLTHQQKVCVRAFCASSCDLCQRGTATTVLSCAPYILDPSPLSGHGITVGVLFCVPIPLLRSPFRFPSRHSGTFIVPVLACQFGRLVWTCGRARYIKSNKQCWLAAVKVRKNERSCIV